MVETVWRSVATPFFKRRVTGPVAFDQVMSNAVPAATPTKSAGVLVICAAWATAKAAVATRTEENCILKVGRESLICETIRVSSLIMELELDVATRRA